MVPALPPPGHWASLYPGCHWPLAYDNAPFLSSGNFSSGVRQGPVIDSHLSGPCPRGPCGAGGLLDLPLVPVPVSRAACAASAGRAGGSCFFLILSPSPQPGRVAARWGGRHAVVPVSMRRGVNAEQMEHGTTNGTNENLCTIVPIVAIVPD